MNLYALKSDDGYLRMLKNNEFSLVGINKASVYSESDLDDLKTIKAEIGEQLNKLRIVKMALEETDFFS